jgi:hypothetical protein
MCDIEAVNNCFDQIRNCDAFYAYLDSPDCFGTICEIGAARMAGKPIYLVFHPLMAPRPQAAPAAAVLDPSLTEEERIMAENDLMLAEDAYLETRDNHPQGRDEWWFIKRQATLWFYGDATITVIPHISCFPRADGDDCLICLDEMSDPVAFTKCGHNKFCRPGIQRVMSGKQEFECPSCRAELTSSECFIS